MKTTDFTYLLRDPEAISEVHTVDLERILGEFPYFQSVAAIRLKGLYKQNDFRYNSELKKTASQTTSREVLHDLITTKKSNDFFDLKETYELEVIDPEFVLVRPIDTKEKREQSILFSIEASKIENNQYANITTEYKNNAQIEQESMFFSLETPDIKNDKKNTPNHQGLSEEKNNEVEISEADKFSFTQWLDLTKKQPIITKNVEKQPEVIDKKLNKIEVIDKFIEANPKIIPNKNNYTKFVFDDRQSEAPTFMTQTLAEIYLKQKKYQKAIEAYEILILKYPKKSSFFADQIDYIKKLQQNNI